MQKECIILSTVVVFFLSFFCHFFVCTFFGGRGGGLFWLSVWEGGVEAGFGMEWSPLDQSTILGLDNKCSIRPSHLQSSSAIQHHHSSPSHLQCETKISIFETKQIEIMLMAYNIFYGDNLKTD